MQGPVFIQSKEDLERSAQPEIISRSRVWLFLVGEHFSEKIEDCIEILETGDHSIFGGIFPSVVFDGKKYEDAALLIPLPAGTEVYLFENLDEIPDELHSLHLKEKGQDNTAMIFLDGLSGQISAFLASLYNQLGNGVQYFGGGAGSLSLKPSPCIISNGKVYQNSAVLAMIPGRMELGVRHGWKKIMGPIVATKTKKNVITELNWENAFQVYQKVLLEDSQIEIRHDNFFEYAKGFPFGLYKEASEDIVRDPIAVNEKGELICVGEVPENSVLYILKGDADSLIESASQAGKDCQGNRKGNPSQVFLIDCISRTLFLEEEFSKELDAIGQQIGNLDAKLKPAGALTLGEISSYGEGIVEFLNKTIVLGMLYDASES